MMLALWKVVERNIDWNQDGEWKHSGLIFFYSQLYS